MRQCVLACCLVAFLGLWLSSACAENYTGDFLTNGVGGRALGMGGAYAALADDVTATYWNPAGIAHVPDKSQIGFMHAARRSGLGSFSYAGAVSRINTWLALGASWIHAGVDDIPIYPAFDPNTTPGERQNVAKFRPTFEPSGFLSDSENAYVLTVGVKQAIGQAWWNNFGRDSRPPEFSMGVNVKWVSQSLGGSRADGIGFDAAILIRMPDVAAMLGSQAFGGFSVGVNVQDVSDTTLTWNTVSGRKEAIPTHLRFGLAYHNEVILGRPVVITYERETRYGGQSNAGLEYQLATPLTLRIGLRGGEFAGGAGVSFRRFRVDYALVMNDLLNTHYVSLLAGF